MRAHPSAIAVIALAISLLLMAGLTACAAPAGSGTGEPAPQDNLSVNAAGANATADVDGAAGNNSAAANEPRPADVDNGSGSASPSDAVLSAGGSDTPEPDPTFTVERVAESDDLRRTEWRVADPPVTVVLQFAAEGRSLLDAMARGERRGGVYESGKRAASVAATIVVRVRRWVTRHKGTLPARPVRITLVEDPADVAGATAADAELLTFAAANADGFATAVWRQLLPVHVSRVLREGLPVLAPQDATGATVYYAWLWAPQVAIAAGDELALDAVDGRESFTWFERWQLADFAGWLMATYNESAVLSAFTADGAKLFAAELPRLWEAWRADRRQLLQAGDPQDPKLLTARLADAGQWTAAMDAMPDLLTALSLRNLRRPAMSHGFAEVAFLNARFDFVWMWLRERVLEPEYNIELLRPMDPPAGPALLALRHVPEFAALAPALIGVEEAAEGAKLLDRAGLRGHARLVRWLRGVIDAPDEVDLQDRLLAWGETAMGDRGLIRFALAVALTKANRPQLAARHAAGIPADSRYAEAWRRFGK